MLGKGNNESQSLNLNFSQEKDLGKQVLSFMQILRSVTGQELTRKILLQSCLQHLLQYFSGDDFTQGNYQGFFLNQADLQAVKSTFLRSQGRLPSP